MSKRNYDDEPFNPTCTGCGPKGDPCEGQQEFDFMTEHEIEQPELPSPNEMESEDSPSQASNNLVSDRQNDLEARRRSMEELDRLLCQTLLRIISSGSASLGHLHVARQYLKDKGYTLPEIEKRERFARDKELLDDLDLPFGNA